MAEVLLEHPQFVTSADGTRYLARTCAAEADNGTWHAWVEFIEPHTGAVLRSGRETTQPNRTDALYWATGLTPVYLEGALHRAQHPLTRASAHAPTPPRFTEPAPDITPEPPPAESILNPFSVYRNGETLLRRQLAALSAWHLVNIIRAHRLSDAPPDVLHAMTAGDMIHLIVRAVQASSGEAVGQ